MRRVLGKKGAELSMNMIIIAILGLIVLVTVVIIFTQKSNDANETLSSCFVGETCVLDKASCDSKNGMARKVTGCSSSSGGSGKYCCRTFGGETVE